MLLSQPVTELTTHVYLPVIQQTAHRLLRGLALTDVIGDQIFIETGFTSLASSHDLDRNATLGSQAFRIEANIQMNPTSQKLDFYTFHHTTAYGISRNTMRDMYPVYWDKDNLIKIVEMRSPVSIVMNCELTVISKELAFQTPQQIFNAYENGAVYELNDFAYDYPVPKAILSVLYGLWKIDRRKGKPAGVRFVDYLQANTDGRWQSHKHRDKDEYEIVIPSYDLQTLGVLEYSDDKPQNESEGKLPIGFTIPFIYTIQFAIPTLNILHYHPVYNNQALPLRMIPQGTRARFNNMEESRRGIDLQGYIESPKLGKQAYAQAMKVPEYDDWTVPETSPANKYYQEPFLIACVTLDENKDLYTELDFSEDFDPSFKIQDYAKEILYQEGERAVELDSLLSVQVYRDNKMLTPYEDVNFTEDLVVKFKGMNLTSHYRVVFTECIQLDKLTPDHYHLVKKYYPFINRALKEQIQKNISQHGDWYDPNWMKKHNELTGNSTKKHTKNYYSGGGSGGSSKKYTDSSGNKVYFQITDNGGIYDNFDNYIDNIKNSTKPTVISNNNSGRDPNGGNRNAHTYTHRITEYGIIARTTQEFKTGNTE